MRRPVIAGALRCTVGVLAWSWLTGVLRRRKNQFALPVNPLFLSLFFPPAALKDPCTEVTCSYGSTCVQSSDGLSAKCMCPLGCEGKAEQTVCGSDGKDYRNECELHQHACKNQKNIRVQYQGHCGKSVTHDRLKPFTICTVYLGGLYV